MPVHEKSIANLNPAQPGEVRNPYGRPIGSRNRNTIAKALLTITYKAKPEVLKLLQDRFPELSNDLDAEEMMTLVQLNKAITKGDTAAYQAILASAYGNPKQPVDLSTDGEPINNVTVHVVHSGPPLANSEKDIVD